MHVRSTARSTLLSLSMGAGVSLATVFGGATGCVLITDIDRTKIPAEEVTIPDQPDASMSPEPEMMPDDDVPGDGGMGDAAPPDDGGPDPMPTDDGGNGDDGDASIDGGPNGSTMEAGAAGAAGGGVGGAGGDGAGGSAGTTGATDAGPNGGAAVGGGTPTTDASVLDGGG